MKKGVLVLAILFLICFSLSVNGLVSLTQFNDSQSFQSFTFSGDSTRTAHVNLSENFFVVSTSLDLTGYLSDWEVVYFYNSTGTSPVDTDYIGSNKWLISDISSGIYLVNPQTGSTSDSHTGTNFYDAEWVSDTKWLYVDYNNNKVVLYNAGTDSEISSFSGLNNPEAADYVSDTKWLVADTGNDTVTLIENGMRTRNFSSGLKQPVDAQYISDEEWVIVTKDGFAGKIVLANSTSNSITKQYTGFSSSIRSVDRVIVGSDEYWLVADSTAGVFLLNMTTGNSSYPNNVLNSYTSTNAAYDARYVGFNDWIITDKDGVKRVQELKKYYPTNLQMSVGGSSINSWSGDFNSTATVNNFTGALNNFLTGCSGTCDIPFNFHSDTSGKLNLTLLNVTYNRKPNVTINAPADGAAWNGSNNFNWDMADDDGDTLSVRIRFWNCTDWIDEHQTSNGPGTYNHLFDTTPYADNNCYQFYIFVNDSYNNASDQTGNFTIDNTDPWINNLRVNETDLIFRSDIGLEWRVDATDMFLQTVVLNGSNMVLESGSTYLNTTTAATLGCTSGANNSCTLTAIATDIVSQTNQTSLMVVIDDVNPQIEYLNSSANGSAVDKDEWVNFTVNASDDNLNVVQLEGRNMTDDDGNGEFELYVQPEDLGCSANSVCQVTATATDKADNSNSTSYNLTINAEPFSPSGGGSSGGGSSAKALCNNGKDDDGDGLIDMADPGCDSIKDNDEKDSDLSCRINWECGEWGECVDGKQTRECLDTNRCGRDYLKPDEEQDCIMPPEPEETFEVESSSEPPLGVGQAVSLFDRIKGNWYYIAGAMAVLGGLALIGWRKNLFFKKKGGGEIKPPFA